MDIKDPEYFLNPKEEIEIASLEAIQAAKKLVAWCKVNSIETYNMFTDGNQGIEFFMYFNISSDRIKKSLSIICEKDGSFFITHSFPSTDEDIIMKLGQIQAAM